MGRPAGILPVNGLAGDEADGSSHAVKIFTELMVVEGTTGAKTRFIAPAYGKFENPVRSSGESGANSIS